MKHYFIKQGVTPNEVNLMSSRLIKNLMYMRALELEQAEFDDFTEKNKQRTSETVQNLIKDQEPNG